jgi:hypothetical protein
MFLAEPRRGAMDMHAGELHSVKFNWPAVRELFATRSFVVNVGATTAMTFAIGGLQVWAPAFVTRVHGYTAKESATTVGVIVAIAGPLGTFAGGFAADYARRWTQASHFLIPGITLGLSAATLTGALLTNDQTLFWCLTASAIFLLFCNSGPLNAAILNVSQPAVRATAFAITIFTIHLLGDALSPAIIGELSDFFRSRLESGPSRDAQSLRYAFLIAPPVMFVGAAVLLVFRKSYPRDVAAVEARASKSRASGGAA